ncbi:MAG: NAD(P)-dependent oxidoreductase [Gemmatimonadaceae bacterium]
MIAWLGTGLLGANFVRALTARGKTVHVWNRSPAKARALEEAGARAFDDPADAVRGASRVHITLKDDETVDDILSRASSGFSKDTIVVDHTTTAPALTAQRVARSAVRFLHAPVFMGPPNALAATGTMLVSGEPDLIAAVKPELAKMTGKVVELGDDPSRAASMKLLGNHLIVVLTVGVSDSLALAESLGLTRNALGELLEFFNPGLQLPARMARLQAEDYENPSWTLAMARKDVRLMQEAARDGNVELMALPGIAERMDEWIGRGRSDDDWTLVSKKAE